jgi:hypothetical protein
LASYLTKGKVTVIDNSESNLDKIHENIIQFNQSTGESICVDFEYRDLFSDPKNGLYEIPKNCSENYDAIFCSYSISRDSLEDFEYLLNNQGGFLVACIDGVVYSLHYNGQSWFEKPLMKVSFPDKEEDEDEKIQENYLRIKKYLTSIGIISNIIDESMDDFKSEGLKKVIDLEFNFLTVD